jgi:DNA invertase Pin-like site-specific DNA recombinase
MNDYTIAKYIRLSLDDSQSDSMSIENQRLILNKHIAEMDIPNARILEMVDNGYSGTNYERPAVQELLALVREGKIDCIAVKDFSRFGRNAIETGYFIERVFPLFRTRFISVGDNFDSAEHEGDTGGMEIAFKFLMHEYYSKDLSRKIKSAKHEKMRRGEAVNKNCAYGYKLNSKRQLEIDEAAADTVKLIFNLAAKCYGTRQIASFLYNDKRLKPSAHKGNLAGKPGIKYIWKDSRIYNILRDEQYTGMYIAGKFKSEKVGSRRTVRVAESEWIKIPDHHPIIIDIEQFNKVQEILKATAQKKSTSPQPRDYLLRKKAFCGCCGHALDYSATKNPVYLCSFTSVAYDTDCYRFRITAAELESNLLATMKERANVILSDSETNNLGDSADSTNHKQLSSDLQDENRCLYEQFVLGNIGLDEYKGAKASLDADIGWLKRITSDLAERANEQEHTGSLHEIAQTILQSKTLTRPLVDLLINKVHVYPDKNIEVDWKILGFGDVVEVVTNT